MCKCLSSNIQLPFGYTFRINLGSSGLSTQLGSLIFLPGLDNLHGEFFHLGFTEGFSEVMGEIGEIHEKTHVTCVEWIENMDRLAEVANVQNISC